MQVVMPECAGRGQGQKGGQHEFQAQRMQWIKEETEVGAREGIVFSLVCHDNDFMTCILNKKESFWAILSSDT